MDRQTTKRLAEASTKALEAVAAEFGVRVKYKSGRYGSSTADLKFEFAEVSEDGTVQSRETEAFTRLAEVYGLHPNDLGRQFKVRQNVYRITGLNTRARKMPIQAERCSDGRGFKFPESVVAEALGRGRNETGS